MSYYISGRELGQPESEKQGAAKREAKSGVLLATQISEMAKANQLTPLLIPKAKSQRFETLKESYGLDLLEERVGFVASLEVVVRNSSAEMMNVMEPDIAREPLKNPRELVEGAALESRFGVIQIVASFPINPFKLMLDVEEPYAGRAGNGGNDELKK